MKRPSRLALWHRDRAQRPAAVPAAILRRPRGAALALIALLVLSASLVSFAESYRGLYLWARHHGLSGVWAALWPLQVDTFVAVGELSLFVALVDGWQTRSRTAAWAVTLAGLAVSVAGNIGHVAGHSLMVRGTAAVPPLAAASALAVGLGVLKRVVGKHDGGGGAAVAALRTDARTETADDAEDAGDDAPMHLAGREAIIADLAEQIRDAITAGERWQPDYAALMSVTGYQRSWCEKAVREARTVAFLTSVRPPVLNGHGQPDHEEDALWAAFT